MAAFGCSPRNALAGDNIGLEEVGDAVWNTALLRRMTFRTRPVAAATPRKHGAFSSLPTLAHASADTFQMEALHSRRTYDYRIQEAICETGDRDLFPELNIPRSTIRSWIHRGPPDVITGDLATHDYAELAAEVERLRRRTARLGAVVGLLIAMLRASRVRLDYERVPEGDARRILLRAIALHAQRTGKVLASPSTWYRLVKNAGWRRPRKRVYPAKPRIGIPEPRGLANSFIWT